MVVLILGLVVELVMVFGFYFSVAFNDDGGYV